MKVHSATARRLDVPIAIDLGAYDEENATDSSHLAGARLT